MEGWYRSSGNIQKLLISLTCSHVPCLLAPFRRARRRPSRLLDTYCGRAGTRMTTMDAQEAKRRKLEAKMGGGPPPSFPSAVPMPAPTAQETASVSPTPDVCEKALGTGPSIALKMRPPSSLPLSG